MDIQKQIHNLKKQNEGMETSFTAKNIQALVRLKRLQINPDFFNVDEHNCWMIPASSIIKENKN